MPVYMVEPYLRRCVDSILSQSFRDFTLVLVDDGSPDNCGNICEECGRLDERVHVIHQKNGGLSAARNTGIDWSLSNTNADWLTFIDSDDWVHPEYLQRLLDAAVDNRVLVSACSLFQTEGSQPEIFPESFTAEVWEPGRFYRENNVIATVACAKLYHRSCFETVRYPVGRIHEDEFVTYRLLYLADSIAYVPAPLYAYYVNHAGITRKAWSAKRLDAWDAYEEQIRFFSERGEPEMHRFRFREYLDNGFHQLKTAQSAPNAPELKSVIRRMKRRMRGVIRRAWKLGYLAFWQDFDMLYACAPCATRAYRYWREHHRKKK